MKILNRIALAGLVAMLLCFIFVAGVFLYANIPCRPFFIVLLDIGMLAGLIYFLRKITRGIDHGEVKKKQREMLSVLND